MADRPLKEVLLRRLARNGTWMARDRLTQGATASVVAADDALADLVMEGRAEYRRGSGYRMAGTDLQRKAAAALFEVKGRRRYAVAEGQAGAELRVGVAEVREELGLVLYDLALPLPQEPGEALQRTQDVLDRFAEV